MIGELERALWWKSWNVAAGSDFAARTPAPRREKGTRSEDQRIAKDQTKVNWEEKEGKMKKAISIATSICKETVVDGNSC